MTTVYFVRHCKPDGKVIDERNRPLTDEGISDSYKVMEMLKVEEEQKVLQVRQDGNQMTKEVGFLQVKSKSKKDGQGWCM